ncbi:S1-like domain-containing RNA-binding protein [bacterium]|nr:S1-like domain-containing RNA-binding protein [bacterium]
MAHIGETTSLEVVRVSKIGLFLDGGDLGEILLPNNELGTDRFREEDFIDVFLYCDSEDRPIATRKAPTVHPGKIGVLKVIETTPIGAFLDWGLPKDLLLPFREQRGKPRGGHSVVVYVASDGTSDRIIATQRVDKFLGEEAPQYEIGQEVDIIIHAITDMGYKAVVDGRFSGLLFENEVFRKLRHADCIKAYVKDVRSDWKVDLSLYPPGRIGVESLEERILAELEKRGGFWEIDDSTPADDIHRELGVSKKVFKKATGSLFKARKITFARPGIRTLAN